MIVASSIIADVAVRGATGAEAQLVGVGAASDSAATKLANLAIGGAALAAGALIGIGAISLKMAADFQQGVNRLKTGAGDTQDSFSSLSASILKVSTDTGILTPQLIASDYLILSAGQRGAQAYATLAAAAQGAVIEQAKVADVTQILTTLQTNFGLKTYTATQYMDGLISAVAHGKITLENLSTAMSPILPIGHELGIHFADIAAAMSDMTNQGIPAAQAATSLRFVFQSMIQPTKASQKAMVEWGLDSAKVATTMKTSLPDALQMYIDAAKRAGPEGSKPFIDALASMMGGGQRAAKAVDALSQSMGVWKTDIKDVNAALRSSDPNVTGWATALGNFNVQVNIAHAFLNNMFMTIGTDLLPMATKFLQNVVMPAIKNFSDWATNTTGLHDAFATLFSIMGNVITDGTALIHFFAAAGPQGEILKTALIDIGIAVATIKFVEMGASLITLTTSTIPAALVKFGLLDSAFVTTAAVEGTAATGATAMGASLMAALGPVAVLVAGLTLGLSNMATAQNDLYTANPLDPRDVVTKADAQAINDRLLAAEHARAMQRLRDAQKVMLDAMQTDYANYTANVSKNQAINDAIMTQNHLKTQQQQYAVQQQYGALMLQQAQVAATGQKKLDDINHYNLLTGTAYYWTGALSLAQGSANKEYQIVRDGAQKVANATADGYQKARDAAAAALEQTRQAVQSKWSQINAILNHQVTLNVNTNDTAAKMEQMRQAVQSKWNQINAIMNRTIYLNVDTVFSQSGAPPVVPFRGFAEGGPVLHTGLALVHAGEYVIPANRSAALPGLAQAWRGQAPVINVYVQSPDVKLDGYRLTDRIMPHLANKIRYGVGGFGH